MPVSWEATKPVPHALASIFALAKIDEEKGLDPVDTAIQCMWVFPEDREESKRKPTREEVLDFFNDYDFEHFQAWYR